MDDIKNGRAIEAYRTLCEALDRRNWKYEKVEDELLVHFGVTGDDLPIQYVIYVDVERQLIRLFSTMPFDIDVDKRIDGAIAACHASSGLKDGSFDYDLSNGQITYRMTQAFVDSDINVAIVNYMIDFSGTVVDKFNDRFFALNKGYLTIEKFLEQ